MDSYRIKHTIYYVMKIYRFTDHYEVLDGDTLYRVSYTLTSIQRIATVDPRVWTPTGGALVQHPVKALLFPIIKLVKNVRDVARTAATASACRFSSVARHK